MNALVLIYNVAYRYTTQFISLLLIGLLSCTKEEPQVTISVAMQTYLDEIVSAMQANSINRKRIDWPNFKIKVNAQAQGAQTKAELYPAIELALTLLGDNHSSYVPAVGGIQLFGIRTVKCIDGPAAAVPTVSTIGYLKVPATGTVDAKGVQTGLFGASYAQALQDAIKAADKEGLQGWIVDLRGNLGGDSWAMLAGVGPILGEGLVGYFVDADSTYSAWSYEQGKAITSKSATIYSVSTPYILRKANPKVAVLTDQVTASAAEVIAVAFKGRANTRSFGNPTCGLSTANISGRLSDGAVLSLAVSKMADRTRTVYGQTVLPDEQALSQTAVDKAVEWLRQ